MSCQVTTKNAEKMWNLSLRELKSLSELLTEVIEYLGRELVMR